MIILSDKGSIFISHVSEEVASVLGITIKHATKKHAQLTGMHERTHASPERALGSDTGEQRSLSCKHVSIAVSHYRTPHHSSIDCNPGRVFHGLIHCPRFRNRHLCTENTHTIFTKCSRCP